MTREEKISYASRLLQEAGVDFKIGKVSYESMGSKNPALDSAAKQFNDALLDEQAKKIEAYKKRLTHLGKIIRKKNDKIEELSAESSKHLTDKVKTFYENQELEKKVNKYAGRLADACTELRELKEKLATIAVNNVNAQALKSAESALVYKEKEYAKSLKEKDEVIDDISKELRICKQKEEKLIASIKEYQKEISTLKFEKKRNKKSRPTEDNPEEIEIKDAVKRIEKALKSGKTVIIDDEASAIGVKSLPADFCKVVDGFFWEMVD